MSNEKNKESEKILKMTEDIKKQISIVDSIFNINEENVDEIFKNIQEYGHKYQHFIRCLEFALTVRPKQTDIINYLLSLMSTIKDYYPSRKILIEKGIIEFYYIKAGLPFFEEGSIAKIIIKDDVESLIRVVSSPDFDSNEYISIPKSICNIEGENDDWIYEIELTYMQLMAYYGSIKCFKYVLMDGSFNEKDISKYAIAGGCHEIIKLLEQKDVSFNYCLKASIKNHRNDIMEWLLNNYECERVSVSRAILFFNLDAAFRIKQLISKLSIKRSLHAAAETADFDLVKYLVESRHAIVECYSYSDDRIPNSEEEEIDTTDEIDERFTFDSHVLRNAIRGGDIQIVKYLINLIGDWPSFSNNEKGYNLIGEAILCDNRELIKYFCTIEDVNEQMLKKYDDYEEYSGETPINIAIKDKNVGVLGFLIEECGADAKNYHVVPSLPITKCLIEKGHINIDSYYANGDDETVNYFKELYKICDAVKEGDISTVKRLIEEEHYFVDQKYHNKTLLHYACEYNQLNIVKYLVEECHASINEDDSYNKIKTLHIACEKGNLDIVKYLIEKCHADVEENSFNGNTPLYYASESENFELVKYLVDVCHADVTNISKKALSITVEKGDVDMVKYLVEKCKVDVEENSFNGNTPLYIACEKGMIDIVKYLVESCGANIERKSYSYNDCGRTPLQIAIKNGFNNIVKYLIENRKTNIENKDDNGNTELYYAFEKDDIPLIKYLINECDANTEEEFYGKTILQIAGEKGDYELIKCLTKDCNVNVDYKNSFGCTVLQAAIINNDFKLVKYLVEECNANVEVKDDKGNTALHIACENENLEIVKYLIEVCHANVEVTSNEKNVKGNVTKNRTPLYVASEKGNYEIVKYLIEKCHANKSAMCRSVLCIATEEGNFEFIKYLIEKCSIGPRNISKNALHVACKQSNFELVKYLVEKCHANVEEKDQYDLKALQYASVNGNYEIIKYLTEECHADLKWIRNDLLYNASIVGSLELVKYLIKSCKSVPQRVSERAMQNAINRKDLEFVKYLVERCHFNIEMKCDEKTSLLFACEKGDLSIVKYLVENCHANLNEKDDKWCTAFHYACISGNVSLVKYLIEECNVNYTERDLSGRTGLRYAKLYHAKDVFNYLVSINGNYEEISSEESYNKEYNDIIIDESDNESNSDKIVLKDEINKNESDNNLDEDNQSFVQNDNTEIIVLDSESDSEIEVCNNDASPSDNNLESTDNKIIVIDSESNSENDNGVNEKNSSSHKLSLHAAIEDGNLELVKHFVEELNADVEEKDDKGRTSLHVAAENGNLEIVKYLVEECHCDVESKDSNGMTALYIANEKGCIPIFQYLIENS